MSPLVVRYNQVTLHYKTNTNNKDMNLTQCNLDLFCF
jgi:hypothetical protein